MAKTLRLVLGDQLNYKHSWFKESDANIINVMMEIIPETEYVTHHIQKVVGFFSAMRTFADQLSGEGHKIIYFRLDDPENQQSFQKNITNLLKNENFNRFEYLQPDEYRLDRLLYKFAQSLKIPYEVYDTEHFLTTRYEVHDLFKNHKQYLMETFYRHVRKKFGILMEDDQPLTGRWNYDSENRQSLSDGVKIPEALSFNHDVNEIVEMLQKMNVKTIGNIDKKKFPWPISRSESLKLLDYFLKNNLSHFGTYQDAMTTKDAYLYHSRLSFSLNSKMLNPLEIAKKTFEYWQNNQNEINFSQLEGFVRQIVGWREFMRGVYWDQMPKYEHTNFFNHQHKLPDFYWTGDTKMDCMEHAITQSLDYAYAHHIQRLMITGNFANLLGVHPDEVDKWYLGIYIDAIQWVEITNTRGMSQFADGGIVATKPYVSSSNYINKMGNYCSGCYYVRTKRYGERACPFNSLYWDFFYRNKNFLKNNPRVGIAYRNLKKMSDEEISEIKKQAKYYKENSETL
jgi:deoxyribodipyrimidine photolyase-related protein